MRVRGRGIAVFVAVCALAMALFAPAASGDGGAKTRITLKQLSPGGAAGELSSGRDACLERRKVSIFVLESFITDKVAITYTNSNGEWRVNRSLKEGVYFAKVDSAKGCRYDNSRRKRLTIG